MSRTTMQFSSSAVVRLPGNHFMPTPEEIKLAIDKHGSMRAAARALNINLHRVRHALYTLGLKEKIPSEVMRGARKKILGITPIRIRRRKIGVSRDQFAAAYDNDTRARIALRKGIQSLDSECIVEDAEFRVERCGHSPTSGWRKIAEEPEFTKYRFMIKGRTFWSTPDTKHWALDNVEGVQ